MAINRPGRIYFTVYSTEPGFPSPEDVKRVADSQNEPNLVGSGMINVTSDKVNEVFNVAVTSLSEEATYFAYMVAEYADADTAILQETPVFERVRLAKRQTEEWFHSNFENRQAGFLSYLPESARKSDESHPLLIFLGGNGEVAQQGAFNLLRNHTLPLYIQQGRDLPFIVVSPQHVQNHWNYQFIDEVVEEAKRRYNVDESRIYMTGISGGGFGTFNYAVNYPEKLAAIVPIAGGGNTYKACELTDMAVWAFHGDKDNIVVPQKSIEMVEAINACNPRPYVSAKLTIYPDVYHNSWRMTYDGSEGHDIFEWMLQYQVR
jgi:predicted peptidase